MTYAPPLSEALHLLERQLVVAEARRWIGTPFHHEARVLGAGVDCIQLLAAVYATVGVVQLAPDAPHYQPDWFLHRSDELLVSALREYAAPLESTAGAGDVVTFSFGRQVSHAGIVIAPGIMIHALAGRNVTLEQYGANTPYAERYAGSWRPLRWLRR